ncbi:MULTISPECIES: hypothetical protein [Enterobacterales]|uniref:HsdR n=1 Tax=Rahnella aquatilis (strain ATCC 33071 / DSM 4594 / JCM 1683 / NBRC 105701 / NCIMB 13365 / CIP 78.65) TaxID=745277 RepID=H2IT62_RAHAC|nr:MULTISPECIES: hypothetical protein [Enterobacterales]EKN5023378.1 hsdR [Yersinia enterocolitica]AEX51581.1 hypothetical protein Rahaq2_1708 [Rahnella aquatilis CIP 78.65 = ATCC 33071]AYH00966.1 hsdR [Pectobacterium parmentieri]EKN5066243.1 hsdR [Yersinia enterocolitica]MDN0114133.1 hsdR [Yersinia intermedia]
MQEENGSLPEAKLSKEVQALINNGLDFLDQAREELKKSKPKFSVVSFWTAVEILLKVPLAHEHWSLICSRKSPPKKQDFQDGDFQSITYDETRNLLRDVLNKPLSSETHQAFDKVRKHRNRLVHFYHPKFTDTEVQQILDEQADAWFRLYQLIRKDWMTIIGVALYHKLLNDESRLLRSSLYYSKAKFRSLADTLKRHRDEGKTIVPCPICKQKAAVRSAFNEECDHTRYESNCLVCGIADVYVEVLCPECGIKQRIEPDGELDFTCEECQHSEPKIELLDESDCSPEDAMIMGGPASCSDCEGYETVCDFGGSYLCVSCLTLHEAVGSCEYCGANSTNIPEMSALVGCSFCSGNEKLLYDD